ncbi:MAG: DUF2306 domain-containing protein [Oceanicoccus sp.]
MTGATSTDPKKVYAPKKNLPGDYSCHPWPKIRKHLEVLGWVLVIFLALTGLSSVIGRAYFLATAFANPEMKMNAFDVRYYVNHFAAISHLIPAAFIAILGPLQFIRPLRKKYLKAHRWSGRIYILSGALGAFSAIAIGVFNPFMGIGGQGFNEAMATAFLSALVLFCLYMAYSRIRYKMIGAHREWMIRSFALMLAIATERTILGALLFTTDVEIGVLFGTTFWMAAVINLAFAEIWIVITRTAGNGAQHWKDVDAKIAKT